VNQKLSLLAQYNSNPNLYKCPADNKLNQGRVIQRSVSMNCAVGTRWYTGGLAGGPPNGPPGEPVGGGWLSGFYADPDPNYRRYGKITQIIKPSPVDLWIIMDENPDTINDPLMAICMTPHVVDFPARYHNGGSGIAFADGHSELHKWMDDFAQTLPPGTTTGQGQMFNPVPPSQDLAWIQPRTSAPK